MKKQIQDEFLMLLSLSNFRKTLSYALIIANTFYFTSVSYSQIDFNNPMQIFDNYLVIKFVAVSILVNFMFYKTPRFFLRIYFHVYIRNWFLKKKVQLESKGKYAYLKEMHAAYSGLKFIIKNYVYRLGYFTRNELDFNVIITEQAKEEMLNEMLLDYYNWICTMIHFLVTLCFIWKFINLWLILVAIFFMATNFLGPFVAIPIVMNLEILNKIRLDIVKDKQIGSKPIELP